jgi:O-antigen/teichoic acid export membrane protein
MAAGRNNNMNRRKRSLQNAAVALLSEVVVALIGFLLPQTIISHYGSRANGLITSLQQLMQYFTLIEAGLSGAAVFSLYKPLAENDTEQIQRILSSARKMYSKIGGTFVLIVAIASALYPLLIAPTGYPNWMVSVLFCLSGLNGATQLLFIGKYKVLLNASQNNRYVVLLNAVSTCLYSLGIIVMSWLHTHILAAFIVGCGAYLVRALLYYLVAKKLFPQYSYSSTAEPYQFKNQREVFIQQILSLLVMNSNILILSFSKTDMAEISVFTVYNMVLTAVFMLTNAVHNGVSASFGDLIARNDRVKLQNTYAEYELLYQIFWTVVFSCVAALYPPFMAIYTGEFTDASYIRPTLCILFSLLGAVWSVRIQQSVLIVAAGKFKEIQKNSIIEALLAVLLSAVGLYFGGLEGMMVGRVIAAAYRMVDFIRFNHRAVLSMKTGITVKGIIGSAVVIVGIHLASGYLLNMIQIDTYIKWAVYAVGVAVCAGIAGVLVNSLLYRQQAAALLRKLRKR